MNKFFIMTRGRTGSTAIVDELNKIENVCATQELFLKFDYKKLIKEFKNLMEHYQDMPPFELWKTQKSWRRFFQRSLLSDKGVLRAYLVEVEESSACAESGIFGFKVLSHNFDETPQLKRALVERQYRAIYLKRNIPRQVISGLIAKQRGIYNTKKDFKDDSRYRINIEEFKSLVKWESQSVENDIAFLKDGGFKFIEVSYEEFMSDRHSFFERIFEFLGVSSEPPQASAYSVMIKDLEHTVQNYQVVVDCAREMGMPIE